MKVKLIIFSLLNIFLLISQELRAQTCADIFTGPIQTTTTGSNITMGWLSQVSGASGNTLDTPSLTDNSGLGMSCGSGACAASGSPSNQGSYSGGYPGGSNISTSWGQNISVSPGNYGNFYHGGNGTITFSPGVYTFSGTFNSNAFARIAISSPGTVSIFVQGNITLAYRFQFNVSNTDRYAFLHSAGNISIGNEVTANALFYGENVTVNFRAEVNGAIAARTQLTLQSLVDVNYDSVQVSNTDTNGFCSGGSSSGPNPIAEWRMEELSWNGTADEVVDSSANGLHGRAVAVNSNYPATSALSPAIAGDPGTCFYGTFDGPNAGYIQVNDPGNASILDLDEFTVTAWIQANSWPASDLMTIASKDDNFEFHLNPGGQIFWWWGNGSNRNLTSTVSVPRNEWHHVAISYERGAQAIIIDGVTRGTSSSNASIGQNNVSFYIGTDWNFDSRNFDGFIDEVRVYDQALNASDVAAIMAETHPCSGVPLIDHFEIDVGTGSASTCAATQITITAYDASNTVLTGYNGTIALSTSTNNGDWSGNDINGSLTAGGSDSGAASYTFDTADQGSIILDLANTHAETLTITVNDSTNGVVTSSSNLSFSENIFIVSPEATQIVGRDTEVEISLWRRDPSTGDCGIATAYNGNQNLKAWLIEQAEDPAGVDMTLSTTSLPLSRPASDNLNLNFTNGVATATLLESTFVGKYSLSIEDTASSFTSGSDISSASNDIIFRPFGFYLEATGNPAATDATGAVFTRAGQTFSLQASAVAWDSGDDLNDDGIPDGFDDDDPANNVNLADNTAAQGFGLESPGETLSLSAKLLSPLAGTDPGLSDGSAPGDARVLSSFALNGSTWSATTNDIQFDEVGIIEITAAVTDVLSGGDYMGSSQSANIIGKSTYVGRFTPDHFLISGVNMTEACEAVLPYSYMGEEFAISWSLQAVNASNTVTINYEGAYAKLISLGQLDFVAVDADGPTALSSRMTLLASNFPWAAGVASKNSSLRLERATSPDGPYTQTDIGIQLNDSDGITLLVSDLDLDSDNDTIDDAYTLARGDFRFGRLRLQDAFGPETADLAVEFVTEYWDGELWLRNADDSCSSIALSEISYPAGSIDIPANRSVSLGAGSSTGTYSSIAGSAVNFSTGDAGHYFSAPGAGNMGDITVDVDLTNYPWLRFDWDQDGTYDDSALPTGHFTFGSYRGHDRIIYWQEILQ